MSAIFYFILILKLKAYFGAIQVHIRFVIFDKLKNMRVIVQRPKCCVELELMSMFEVLTEPAIPYIPSSYLYGIILTKLGWRKALALVYHFEIS